METSMKTSKRAGRLSRLGNERGMLLVITMITLLVVSTLAAANLINAFLERSLAKNQNYASIALNAADAGVNAGAAWVNDETNLATIPVTGNWTRPGDPVTVNLASGGSYDLTISFKLDTLDGDCDGDCIGDATIIPPLTCATNTSEVVFFTSAGYDPLTNTNNRPAGECTEPSVSRPANDGHFAFPGSIYKGAIPPDKGYPIITINSKGRSPGGGFREIEMDLARNKLAAQIEGAFTARAGVTATGSSFTDGNNYSLTGALANSGATGCMAPKPGVTVDVGNVAPPCPDTNLAGSPCSAVYDPTAPGKLPLQKTPWGVLGISQTDFTQMFGAPDTTSAVINDPACSPNKIYKYYGSQAGISFNNASPCTDYSGILVIHNVGFDPDLWEANCDTAAKMTTAFCSTPANQPAVFNMNGNVSWTGIVIADQVVRVSGTPLIRGGIISLASGGIIDSDITGNISVQYSCEAVTGATNQGYKTRLGWHRLN